MMASEPNEWVEWLKIVGGGFGLVVAGVLARWGLRVVASSTNLVTHRTSGEVSIIDGQAKRIEVLETREKSLQAQVDELRDRAYKGEDAAKQCERRYSEIEVRMADLRGEIEMLRKTVFFQNGRFPGPDE